MKSTIISYAIDIVYMLTLIAAGCLVLSLLANSIIYHFQRADWRKK